MALMEASGNLGSAMPQFTLPDVYGNKLKSADIEEDVLVVLFICGHCPYVQAIEKRLIDLDTYFKSKSVKLIGICANDAIAYPEDSVEALRQRVERIGIEFSYLVDETQETARAFDAVCTPDIFVFNKERNLTYHGQLDDNWKNANLVKREDLKLAIERTLKNESIDFEQVPTIGCSIKWK